MKELTLYYVCGDDPDICGGLKVIYQHVDLLNEAGYRAFVLHEKRPYRAHWFLNQTPIAYLNEMSSLTKNTILVIPEVMGYHVKRFFPGIPKVMFCQNPYYTFQRYGFLDSPFNPYRDCLDIVGTLAISEDAVSFLAFTYGIKAHRVYNSIDTNLFYPAQEKKPIISFMPRKCPRDAINVIMMLRMRGVIKDFTVKPLQNVTEETVARTLRESLLFLSFAKEEGFGLPTAEAMCAECVVIGYPAMGGNEFFNPDFSFPIEAGNLVAFVEAIEKAILLYREDKSQFQEIGQRAGHYIREHYSLEKQKHSVLSFFEAIKDKLSCSQAMMA